MIWMLARLAFAGIRRRRLASFLIVVLAGAAVATVVLALQIGQTVRDPWQQTFDAAHGAHVLFLSDTEKQARSLQTRQGVTEAAAPAPVVVRGAEVVTGRGPVPVWLTGLDAQPAVNAPVRLSGSVSPGDGIVLEQSLAGALGLEPGSTLRVTGPGGEVALDVVGTAVLPSQGRYPRVNPGVAWVASAVLPQLQPDRSQWRWGVGVRLADPESAPALASSVLQDGSGTVTLAQTWQEQRADAMKESEPFRLVLTMYSTILLAVVFVVVAILAGARALQQHREIGLLKAVGLTPRQVTGLFVLESAALGLVASVLGFVAGTLLAPRLARTAAASLVGAPTVTVDLATLPVAAAPVLLVLVVSAWTATRRRTRFSVLQAIGAGRATPATSRLASRLRALPLPVPLSVGARTVLAGRGHVALMGVAICLVGAMFVFAMSMQASLSHLPAGQPSDVSDELPAAVYSLDAVLLVIAFTSLLAVALLSVRERLRDFAVLKTIGLTPRQVAATFTSPYATIALLAGLASVPLGIALYVAAFHASGGDSSPTIASWPWLALVPLSTTALVLAAAGGPARIATRTPAATALRSE